MSSWHPCGRAGPEHPFPGPCTVALRGCVFHEKSVDDPIARTFSGLLESLADGLAGDRSTLFHFQVIADIMEQVGTDHDIPAPGDGIPDRDPQRI